MPNWVKNYITFVGDEDEISKMLNDVKDDSLGVGSIDFNKVVRMPEDLNIECGSRTDEGYKKYTGYLLKSLKGKDVSDLLKYKEEHPDCWDLGEKAYNNIKTYGYRDWYDWSIAKWGTKWNACSQEDYDLSSNYFCFETAWSAPTPIVKELSKKYPNVLFEIKFADEDIGNNCGVISFKNGCAIEHNLFDYSKRSIIFACEIWDYDPEEFFGTDLE